MYYFEKRKMKNKKGKRRRSGRRKIAVEKVEIEEKLQSHYFVDIISVFCNLNQFIDWLHGLHHGV